MAESAAFASKLINKSMVPLLSDSESCCLTISSLSFGSMEVFMLISAFLPLRVRISIVSFPVSNTVSAFPKPVIDFIILHFLCL